MLTPGKWEFKVNRRKLLQVCRRLGFCYRCCQRLGADGKCAYCAEQRRLLHNLQRKQLRWKNAGFIR